MCTPATSMPPGAIEFVSPPTAMPDLDIGARVGACDTPLFFPTMKNILGSASSPRVTERVVVEDLLAAK
jgi:hypothetical protein